MLAVTGGRTIALTGEALEVAAPLDITVVPAQGGMGEGVNTRPIPRRSALPRGWGAITGCCICPTG